MLENQFLKDARWSRQYIKSMTTNFIIQSDTNRQFFDDTTFEVVSDVPWKATTSTEFTLAAQFHAEKPWVIFSLLAHKSVVNKSASIRLYPKVCFLQSEFSLDRRYQVFSIVQFMWTLYKVKKWRNIQSSSGPRRLYWVQTSRHQKIRRANV